jgi:hypothetical protein
VSFFRLPETLAPTFSPSPGFFGCSTVTDAPPTGAFEPGLASRPIAPFEFGRREAMFGLDAVASLSGLLSDELTEGTAPSFIKIAFAVSVSDLPILEYSFDYYIYIT